MSAVVAISPPTLIWLPLPNSTPLELISQTFPVANRLPSILDGEAPSTRLRVMDEELGCRKLTPDPDGIEKLFQLINAFCVDCEMVVLLPP